MISILIAGSGGNFHPVVLDQVTWSLERQGTPGKLSFSILQDKARMFEEGSRVCLQEDGTGLFYGFIFDMKTGRDGKISITAYDQLRYLKNKDTYMYENKTASEVIRMIAGDFNLDVGNLADTGHKIAVRSEPDKTLFDIILNAVALTMMATNQMFIFYDDYGKLTLKNVTDMKVDTMIRADTAGDYDYSSGIDGETYNQVKVSIDNDETGKREIYLVKHSENINAWGILQHYKKAEKGENGQALAEQLLTRYNNKTRKLSVKNALGDSRVRVGSLVPVLLDLGDTMINNYMLAEKVTHNWKGALHTMDLTLRGGDFIV